ncbi:MAG TPA: helicase HerA-like domain-containing protein [Pirellulales bacterium]|nr:helicase HerA-like domain-containing protein [Pirellulales bacterium]
MAAVSTPNASPDMTDPRVRAFCAPQGREVFHSICHAKEICSPDPFDVRSIHAEAREVFETMLARATTPPGTAAGRTLLLLGESGSGKTHLMRAFRNHVHGRGLGYCGYLQMTTPTHNYGRYILSKLLASLDERYDEPTSQLSGLMCLSNALVGSLGPDYESVIDEMREARFGQDELNEQVYHLANDLLEDWGPKGPGLRDAVRAMIYMQRQDPALRAAAHSYLRCEALGKFDRAALGELSPRTDDSHPMEMIESLGRLMWSAQERPLVLFVDQLEEMYNLENAKELFRRAMGAINTVAENVPSAIIIVACLEDYYEQLKSSLAQSLVDKIERDPDKLRLESQRSEQEVLELAECRLAVLYEDAGVAATTEDPTFPIPAEELRKLRNLRTRDVLDWCRRFQEQYRLQGRIAPAVVTEASDKASPDVAALEEAWQTFLAEGKWKAPADEPQLAETLAAAIVHVNDEAPANGGAFEASCDGRFVALEIHAADSGVEKILAGVCNKRPQGGGLAKQVAELEQRAGEHGRFIVRSVEFPASPGAKISGILGDFLMRGGRRAVFEDSHWRTMLAFEDFRRLRQDQPGFAAWLQAEKPLTRLKPLRELLQLDRSRTERSHAEADAPSPANGPIAGQPNRASDAQPPAQPLRLDLALPLRLGSTTGLSPMPVEIGAGELTRHAAFLGGSGSGKTTVALNLVEQLLERGVPCVLVDRKGDLCGYADLAWREAPAADEAGSARRFALSSRIDLALYTPGNARGRAVRLPVVPAGMSAAKDFDQLASSAAAALASMIGLHSETRHGPQRAILLHAIRQLAMLQPHQESSIEDLVELIHSEDPRLVNAVGKLDGKHFKKIVEGLETLRLTRGELFDPSAERLDFDRLLGPRSDGRTQLTVISTKFLGEMLDVQFWMAQFLNELRRWASRNPSNDLQAAVLFDEADIYLPARTQPASKGPMEDLLKRGRSAGIGLLLATQSPGDLDYKCRENIRSWFLGRIKENTALGKLKPMLENARYDVAARLAAQAPGEFQYVHEGNVASFKAERSLMPAEQQPEEEILRLAACQSALAGSH